MPLRIRPKDRSALGSENPRTSTEPVQFAQHWCKLDFFSELVERFNRLNQGWLEW